MGNHDLGPSTGCRSPRTQLSEALRQWERLVGPVMRRLKEWSDAAAPHLQAFREWNRTVDALNEVGWLPYHSASFHSACTGPRSTGGETKPPLPRAPLSAQALKRAMTPQEDHRMDARRLWTVEQGRPVPGPSLVRRNEDTQAVPGKWRGVPGVRLGDRGGTRSSSDGGSLDGRDVRAVPAPPP